MKTRRWFVRTAALLGALAMGLVQPVHAFDDQGLKALTQKIATKLGSAQKNTIAVVDFVNLEGGTTLMGRFLAEEIANGLGNSERNFEIVDRNHLNSIMKEHKLASTGFIDKLTTSTLGNMTGAQALVIGTITPFGDSLRVTVKVLDTKTAKQMVSESVEFPKTKALQDMYDKPLPEAGEVPPAKNDVKAAKAKQVVQPEEEDSESDNVVEVQGLRLQLVSCEKGGQNVTCRLTVQNPTHDSEIYVSKQTRIFDDKNSEFAVSEGKIANGGNYPGYHGDCLMGKSIVAGVETPIQIVFHEFVSSSKRLSSLEFLVANHSTCGEPKKVSFRNVVLAPSRSTFAKKGGGSASPGDAGAPDGAEGGSLLDDAVDTVKGGMRSLLQGGFDKLKKKAKIPDPPPSDPHKQ